MPLHHIRASAVLACAAALTFLEGFALAPASACVSGFREAVWSDDGIYGFGSGSSSYGHALYSGTFPC